MTRPLWLVKLIKKAYPARYFLSHLTRQSSLVRSLVDHFMFGDEEMIILTKDSARINSSITIHVGEMVQKPAEIILPSQIVEHYINKASHLWIMNKCACREAAGCHDYPIDLGCLFLGEAVLGINPGLGHMVTRDEARSHIQRAAQAGLVHVIGRNNLDSLWLGVGPGNKLMTVCSCCPCCCLYKIIPHLSPEISRKFSRMPGVKVEVIPSLCTGCGACTREVCFLNAIKIENGRAVISAECRACGRCTEVCPNGAIRLVFEDGAYVRETIERVNKKVNIE